MTEQEQQERARKFFAMLASFGVTECLCVNPPEGGSVNAKIEQNGEVSMLDKRDGQRKKIKVA